jgi:NAD(P)-dependent dehydrogenase (short-subunit alcohol dehydrogenase family)
MIRLQVNNSGGQFDPQVDSADLTMREMWNKSWDVNTTGTHILTHTFLPLLLKSFDPRLLFITSGTSSLTESENLTLE